MQVWPNCSCVQRIQGLSQCPKLHKLFLYQNCITRVQGLAGLDELSTLWLNSNKITCIEVGRWGRERWVGWAEQGAGLRGQSRGWGQFWE